MSLGYCLKISEETLAEHQAVVEGCPYVEGVRGYRGKAIAESERDRKRVRDAFRYSSRPSNIDRAAWSAFFNGPEPPRKVNRKRRRSRSRPEA